MNTLTDLRALCDHAERQFNGGQLSQALRGLPTELGRAARPDLADHERLRLLSTRARLLISYVYLDGEESRSAHHALNDAQRIADRRLDRHSQATLAHERGRLSLIEQLRFEQPDYFGARAHLQSALVIRESIGTAGELAATLIQHGSVSLALRQPEDALAATSRAHTLAKAHACKPEQAEASLRLGLLLRARGDADGALTLLNESLRLREEIGLRVYLPFSYQALGETLMLTGRMNEARLQLECAATAATAVGLRRAMMLTQLTRAEWHIRADQRSEALEELRSVLRLANQLRHDTVRKRAADLIERLTA